MGRERDSRRVSAKEALELIKGPLPNVELMKRLRISTKGLADLLTQLLVKGLITEDDLERRGVRHKFQKKSTPRKTKSPKGPQSIRTASEVVMDISVGTGTMTVTAIETPPINQQKAVLIDSSVITEVVTLQPLEEPPVAAEQVHQYIRPLDHQDDIFLDTTALTDLLSSNIPSTPAASSSPSPVVRREKERVTIRFMPGCDHFVSSRLLHPAQKIMRQSDGSFLTTVDVSIDRHLVTWILSFGAMAEVVEPEKLRVMIHEELSLAAGRYEREQAGGTRNRKQPLSESAKMTGLVDYWDVDKK